MKIGKILMPLALALLLFAVPPAHAGKILGIGGLCLDIKGGAGKGKSVIMWKCNGQVNQTWYLDAENHEVRSAEGYCLDVKGGKDTKGAQVIAWPCHNRKNQRWYWHENGTVRTSGGLCLDVERGDVPGVGKGANVIVWPCKKNNNNKNQRWKYQR